MIEVSSLAVLFGVGDVDDLSMSLVTHFNVDRGLLRVDLVRIVPAGTVTSELPCRCRC